MTDSWAISGVDAPGGPGTGVPADPPAAGAAGADLHLDLRLDRTRGGVRRALTRALREAIATGRLAPGARLPSSRALAADLGLARNTVADAYAELVAEGRLTARQGSGTRVARRAEPAPVRGRGRALTFRDPSGPARPFPGTPAYSLLPGLPDAGSFPRTGWATAMRRALATAPNEAFGYTEPRGRRELRVVLAEYLARARGVRADPERIVLCAGFVHGLMLLSSVLREAGGRRMAVEEYGLGLHRELIRRTGLATVPLAVDEHGARTGELARSADVSAVLLTPAHQFPLGMPLHPDRRAAVVDWARATGGLVIEDDYDGEFRYDRQPVGALQGLDPEHVVYVGTVSKSLSPALRLAWMVLPERLLGPVTAAKGAVHWHSSALDQLALADFIASGAYDRHVRGMRQRYRRRRDRLVAALAEHAPGLRVGGIAAGLHAVLRLPPGAEGVALAGGEARGLALDGLSRYASADSAGPAEGLVIGYGTPPEHAFAGALEALCAVLRGVPAGVSAGPPPGDPGGSRVSR
ncbi:PLP-dependent aminotransferase family protein [Streptomyces sp. URMC 123]|uniref:MocR-like pyridoxine biosynthesis transcription factor PdxR n=1 Tax=Streptomyces sp. URMC 123 TaxID=3423403 RepID=UPI003F198405